MDISDGHTPGPFGDSRTPPVVTQASTAIPVVPLYVSLLFKVMKQQRVHEDLIEHVYRLFATQLYSGQPRRLDESGRIRLDDVELSAADIALCWCSTSRICLPICIDGLSEVIGSWKIIEIPSPRILASAATSALTMSVPR